MLTEFFKMNKTNLEAQALKCTYRDFPEHFVWLQSDRTWKKRDRGVAIGRIVAANPIEGERYFLRLLLLNFRGPTSYDDLKIINGTKVETFREAAVLRGLFDDNTGQEKCLEEASLYHMPYSLRRLFASILVHYPPNNPRALWEKFEAAMSEDFIATSQLTSTEIRHKVLYHISNVLESMEKNINSYNLLPRILTFVNEDKDTRDIESKKNIVVSEEDLSLSQKLNNSQSVAYNLILERVYHDQLGAFFVDGPGGTGKTFLYRALLANIRSKGYIGLATATSGVAASILSGGRKTHSRFKIPINLEEQNVCKISKQSGTARLLKEAKLIIWDEAPMAHRGCIEVLDRLLRDIMDTDTLFGGKVIVFGGDFRQVLPVVPKGSRQDSINACLLKSYLWPLLEKIRLTENMRARLDPTFTDFLLRIGNGTEKTDSNGNISLPRSMMIPFVDDETSLQSLIQTTYPNIENFNASESLETNRAILTTKNLFVDQINEILINRFPGPLTEYTSCNKTIDSFQQSDYKDFLNGLSCNGLPPHKLFLKPNCPIMLLRNMNPPEGLCNGTRLICKTLDPNVIGAVISAGEFAGKPAFIHRIKLTPSSDEHCGIPFERIQFPVRLCFAMTINKAQGQTLDFVGIYLREPVFSHGQLYVALSRARNKEAVKILIRPFQISDSANNTTRNIVYSEVFDDNDI